MINRETDHFPISVNMGEGLGLDSKVNRSELSLSIVRCEKLKALISFNQNGM